MIEALITAVIYLLIVGVILWLVLYLIDSIPLPPPFQQIARAVVIVVGCLILIMFLLNLLGGAGGLHLRLPH